jgi:NAD(P)-dependent dehydrogenase (short-subunit alcohol dehydrogenase family)
MSTSFQGKTVVITGANGRLGQQVVRAFAEQGATLALVTPTEAEAYDIHVPEGVEAWAFPCDATDEASVGQSFDAMRAQFGTIDVLVHTVGGWASSPVGGTTLDEWRAMVDLNLTSTFLAFRAASGLMEQGRLIAIASGQGADKGVAEQAAYSAAKAGVVRLVEAVAGEHEGRITAHAVAPSTLLAEGETGQGVAASAVADLIVTLCGPAGDALNGQTVRAYGSV